MLQFLRQILCERATATRLTHPGVDTLFGGPTPRVRATIRQTNRLTERHNRIPEEVSAYWIANALKKSGLGYSITYGFSPVDSPTEQAVCGEQDAGDYYRDVARSWPHSQRDANLLLTDAQSGGCARYWSRPRVASVGCRNLSERRTWTPMGTGDYHGAIQSILHEVGHCLGAHHDHDPETKGNQHPGIAYNDDERQAWVYTPTVFAGESGGVNKCGETVEAKEYEAGMKRHTYSDCAVDTFREVLTNRQ